MPDRELKPEETLAFRKWYQEYGDEPLHSVPYYIGSGNHRYWIGTAGSEPLHLIVNLDPDDKDFLKSRLYYSDNHYRMMAEGAVFEGGPFHVSEERALNEQ